MVVVDIWQAIYSISINVWVTKWYQDKMVEIRTYIDAPKIMEALHKNEIW